MLRIIRYINMEMFYLNAVRGPTENIVNPTRAVLVLKSSIWKKRKTCPKRPRYGRSSENTPLAMLPHYPSLHCTKFVENVPLYC